MTGRGVRPGPRRRSTIATLVAALAVIAACSPGPDVVAERGDRSDSVTDDAGHPDDGAGRDGEGGDGADGEGSDGAGDPEGATPAPDPPADRPDWPTDRRSDTDGEPTVLQAVDLAAVAEIGDGRTPRPYDELVAAAIADLEDWMSELHPRLHGETWEPLGGGVWPSYPGRDDIPGCGEARTDPADVSEYVAFYCAGRDFMVFDDGPDSLLGELADEFGPLVMGVVLAHEYGHVVQDRIGAFDRRLPTILTEQQADCVSGAWVARAVAGESRYVRLTEADVRGALIAMVAVRDPVGTDQFEPGGHGTAFDRIGAFQEGFTLGPDRCAELLDDPLPLMPNQFQTTSDLLNDGDLPFGYDDGDIVPLVVGALNEYWPGALDLLDAGTFTPMTLVPVDSPDEISCSGPIRSVAPGLARCPTDATVFLDDGFARRLYQDPIVGSADFAVGYFVALAWADTARESVGSPAEGSVRALTNDCLVGAWTQDLDPDRPERPGETVRAVISPGDLDEAVVAAIELGDAGPADNRMGVPFDKVAAFRTGVLGGLGACLDVPASDPDGSTP